MVTLEEIQSAYYMVAATGVLIAAIYYLMALRNTEKIKSRDLIFQRLNVNMIQHYNILYEVLNIRDWNTYEEFLNKYSLTSNPETFAKI